jgi:hypothetical protein
METCSWRDLPDDEPCGEPAEGFRVRFIPTFGRWYYCRRHLRTLRRMTPDAEAKVWGVETYPILVRAADVPRDEYGEPDWPPA